MRVSNLSCTGHEIPLFYCLGSIVCILTYVFQKGELDLTGAARIVLRDWSSGKLVRFTTPPSPSQPLGAFSSNDPGSNIFATEFYADDGAILATLSTRKEMRKKGGLVKLFPGSIEERKVEMEQNWVVPEESESENSEDGHPKGSDEDDLSTGVDDEVSEDEDNCELNSSTSNNEEVYEASLSPVLSSRTQKRKRDQDHFTALSSSKQVSLGRETGPKKGILKKRSANSTKKASHAKLLKKDSTAAFNNANEPEAYDFGKFF